jgi:hypothetical protein
MEMYNAIPIKFLATYVLTDDDLWKSMLDQYLRFLPTSWRVRTRILRGTYEECVYDLFCVGVPKVIISNDLSLHNEWIDKQRHVEGVKRRKL